MKKVLRALSFALTGWVAGALMALLIGLVWPAIFPAIIRTEHYYGSAPSLGFILGLAILFASPATLIGGLIASRIPNEGGSKDEYLMAALAGAFLNVPFACYGLWLFTGW